MNKRLILSAVLILSCVILNSLEVIHVAPFYHIDEAKDEVHPNNDYHKMLIQKLHKIETGLDIVFSLASLSNVINPPQSLAEAIRVCQNEHANYLLYGYIATRDYTIYAEIKLLDYERRSITRIFYSTDDLANIDRLLNDLTVKILTFVEETYNIKILEHEPQYTEWWAYGRLGYWTPIGNEWFDLMIGTVSIDFGIVFFPADRLFVWWGFPVNLSIGLEVSYQFGLGKPDRYKAYDHIITFGLPFRITMRLNDQHGISGGIGLLYRFDLLQFQAPYDDGKLLPYTSLGASVPIGYSFRIREYLAISADNRFDILLNYNTAFFSYSLRFGVDYRFSKKEIARKW